MGRGPELFNSGYYEYFKNIINSGYYGLSGAREHVSSAESALLREWCMRVVHESDAWEYVSSAESALLRECAWEWCTRVVHESSAREFVSGARDHVSAWVVNEKNFSRLGMGPPQQTLVEWEWGLQEKQLLLSEARSRAAGSGEVKTGEEELLSMQELRWYCPIWLKLAGLYTQVQALHSTDT